MRLLQTDWSMQFGPNRWLHCTITKSLELGTEGFFLHIFNGEAVSRFATPIQPTIFDTATGSDPMAEEGERRKEDGRE